MTLLRRLLRLPLASLAGCGLALFAGLAWAFAAPTCGAATMAPFVGCAAPAIVGLWIDWARLYPTTRRAIGLSGALLGFALLLGAGSALLADTPAALAIAPAGLITVAMAILVGARVLYWLATRGRSAWGVITGVVRNEERDRFVLSTADGEVAELDRSALDLGGHRSLEIAVGSPLAVLACVAPESGAPYRSEPRLHVTHIATAGEDVHAVRRRLFARARAWAIYAFALAVLATSVTAAFASAVPADVPVCPLRGDFSDVP